MAVYVPEIVPLSVASALTRVKVPLTFPAWGTVCGVRVKVMEPEVIPYESNELSRITLSGPTDTLLNENVWPATVMVLNATAKSQTGPVSGVDRVRRQISCFQWPAYR